MKSKPSRSYVGELRAIPVRGVAEVKPGESLAAIVVAACSSSKLAFEAGDILVLKHKIVAKAEGRIVLLDSVKPSRRALATPTRGLSSSHCAKPGACCATSTC